MTTREQWKAGILITGMLIIAVVLSYNLSDRHVAQSQPRPTYQLPRPAQQVQPPPAPAVTAPAQPQYPIHKAVVITQDGWSEEITLNNDEQLEWNLLEEDSWLDIRVNRTEEFRQFPPNDSRWKPLTTPGDTRILSFRITPGTPVIIASLDLTIRKSVGGGFFARERTLQSATPSMTDAGVKAAHQWPADLTPTRFGKFPPDGYGPGSGDLAIDTVYPVEDVMYRVARGWTITPLIDGGKANYETARVPGGFRLRVLNPDTPIVVRFKMVRPQNNDAVFSAQRTPANQGDPNWNATPFQPPITRPPVVRPYVAPQPPSYYPTSPAGPTYYPSSSPSRHR